MNVSIAALGLCAVVALAPLRAQTPAPGSSNRTITAVPGIKVGHHTLAERPTGCTVILVDGEGAVGGVSQRGGAPGTRETDLLDPANTVDKVNAVVLSGGSAFGLDAVDPTIGPQGLDGRSHAAGQAAAADRDDHRVDFRQLFDQFQTQGGGTK